MSKAKVSAVKIIAPSVALVALTVFFEWATRHGIIPEYMIPRPSRVFDVFFEERDTLIKALSETAFSSFLGLFLSILLGASLGALSYLVPLLGWVVAPYTVFFQTVPIIAIAPLLVIWLGFGLKSVVASSFIVSVFPIISGTLQGFQSVDKNLLYTFRIHQASLFKTLSQLLLPSSLPNFFQALRVSSGLSVIGAIVGEFMSGSGLGSVIEVARVQFRVDLMFAAILLSALFGLFLLSLVNALSYFFLRRWHASVQEA